MRKINVVGTSASGKTTLSRRLAKKLNLDYIELDDLLWQNNWQETSDPEFFEKIQNKIRHANADIHKNGYVIDGNYSRTTHITWQEIDTVIWLDIPFHINLFQSIYRALTRAFTKKQLWMSSNNTESFSRMFGRESIVKWMIKTHAKNRKKYLAMMNNPQYAHIRFVRLESRKQAKTFIANLS